MHWHGKVGSRFDWENPVRTFASSRKARPEYTDIESHEYHEVPRVLDEKVNVLIEFLRASTYCVAYTGAGLSVPSGLDDYATASRQVSSQERGSGPIARPSLGHHVLTRMHLAGILKSVVNQNHDSLLQKAGFPPQHVNEIHGSWFDPSNPGGNILRDDLFEDLLDVESKADLCLAMGTSLSGLNADRLATSSAQRQPGLVVVNLQATPLDKLCSLRIFAPIELVLTKVAERLQLPVLPSRPSCEIDVCQSLPYDPQTGEFSPDKTTSLLLTKGSKIRIVRGSYANCTGVVDKRTEDGWEILVFQTISNSGSPVTITDRHWLGVWWINAARQGHIRFLPIVPESCS